MKTESERFWAKVRKSDDPAGCWEWIAYKTREGYGNFYCDGGPVNAHRWAYEAAFTKITAGLHIDHLCRNRACVNPAHLEAVTCRENILRGQCPTILAHHGNRCVRGHEFTPENTITWTKRGVLVQTCRECRNARQRVENMTPEQIAKKREAENKRNAEPWRRARNAEKTRRWMAARKKKEANSA